LPNSLDRISTVEDLRREASISKANIEKVIIVSQEIYQNRAVIELIPGYWTSAKGVDLK
jgi:hypothetical protein